MDASPEEDNGEPEVKLKLARSPDAPTNEERLKHEQSHHPYRAWCPHCVAAKGRRQQHRAVTPRFGESRRSVARLTLDYAYLSGKTPEQAALDKESPILVVFDDSSSWLCAHMMPSKDSQWGLTILQNEIVNSGHAKLIL